MAEADPKLKDKPKGKGLPPVLVPLLACVLGAAAGGAGAAIAVLKFAPGLGSAAHAPAPSATAVPAGPLDYVEVDNAFTSILAFVMRFDDPEGEAVPDVFVPPALDFDEHGQPRKAGAPLPL